MRAVSVLLLACLAPVASGDEPVTFRWSLKEGDTFYATTRVTQTHAIEVGGKTTDTTLTFDLTLRYHVSRVKDGETEVDVTYLAASIRASGQADLDGIGAKVRGTSISIRLDKKHALTAIRGQDDILKKFRDAPAGERETATALFGAGGIRELVGRPFDILPAQALRVGEHVTRDDGGGFAGLSSTGKTTTKLESVTAGVAKVTVVSDMTIKAAGLAGPGAKVDLRSERAEGGYTFEMHPGRVKNFSHETVIGGTITTADAEIKITIRQKQTVTISDKNPVRD